NREAGELQRVQIAPDGARAHFEFACELWNRLAALRGDPLERRPLTNQFCIPAHVVCPQTFSAADGFLNIPSAFRLRRMFASACREWCAHSCHTPAVLSNSGGRDGWQQERHAPDASG